MPEPTYKKDVYLALVHAIIELGKNNPDGCKNLIARASKLLDQWLIDRPEKRALEDLSERNQDRIDRTGDNY
jgi:hypothetical protein